MIWTQEVMTIDKAKEDFSIFKTILLQGHPNVYEYIDQDALTTLLTSTEAAIDSTITRTQLYQKMLTITTAIKDGNLRLFPSAAMNPTQAYFPLVLKIIGGELFTDTDDFGIPVGTKITAINGIPPSKILEKLKKYVAADGHNLTKKYRDIELQFGIYYAYEYGSIEEFRIDYITPKGVTDHIHLAADSLTNITYRNTKRSSYFATYHKLDNGMLFYEQYMHPKMPFIYYKGKTPVLVVHSFRVENTAFQSRLIALFRTLRKSKAKHLIIDIRYNDGGFRANVITLYSFIATHPFKEMKSISVSSLTIPERKHATHILLDEERFLKEKFYPHPTYEGWTLQFDDLETLMVPRKDRFTGKVYVLAGGNTISEANTFAIHAKEDPKVLLVGEETGGGYYSATGGFPVYYEFPNSKIMLGMSMQKNEHYVQDNTVPIGSGVPPERYIPLTIQDLIEGRDAPLDYVLKLTKK